MRDPEVFEGKLKRLRDVACDTNGKYYKTISQAQVLRSAREVANTDADAGRLEDEGIEGGLTKIDLPLEFKSSGGGRLLGARRWFIENLEVAEKNEVFLISMAARNIRKAMESDANRLFDVRLRRAAGLPVWNIYERPTAQG